MTHLIDAERLLAAFDASHDAHVPSIVFSLLGIYLRVRAIRIRRRRPFAPPGRIKTAGPRLSRNTDPAAARA